MAPRLLLLAAVVRAVLLAPVSSFQRAEPILGLPPELLSVLPYPEGMAGIVEAPMLAAAALVMAGLLRASGHRMRMGLYVVGAVGITAAAVVLALG